MTTLKADTTTVSTGDIITFSQIPTLPTATLNNSTTNVANTAYVQGEISNYLPKTGDITISGIKTFTSIVTNLQAPIQLIIDGTGLSLGRTAISTITMRGVQQSFDSTWKYLLTSIADVTSSRLPSVLFQTGTVDWSVALPSVIFPIAFTIVPTIYVSSYNDTSVTVNIQTFSQNAVSLTGFTIRSSGTTSQKVNWLAVSQ